MIHDAIMTRSTDVSDNEQTYKAWPYREAMKIAEKLEREQTRGIKRKHEDILFQTGFGPSGLPHIGTFSEVARTKWVRQAYEAMHATGRDTTLYTFSDDMDGMRSIPLDMPNPESLIEHFGKPLSNVPDPFGVHESFAAHMNAKLQDFLNSFGFKYTFRSSKELYTSGAFNEGLLKIVEHYDAIRELVANTLSEENKEAWSPFLPICEQCGRVTTTRVTGIDTDNATVSYVCDRRIKGKILTWEPRGYAKRKQEGKDAPEYYEERKNVEGCGHEATTSVLDGKVKAGWKVDWAMRWYVFGVDYEMYGKDLIASAALSSQIVKIMGGEPPAGMFFEWFNDAFGRSISKTKGNGLSIEEWLTYGPIESLGWYVYQNPTKAKKLYFEVIPQSTDRFLKDRQRYGNASEDDRPNNPIHFSEADLIEQGHTPTYESEITFGVLLNLVSVLNTEDRQMIWDYILRYDEDARVNETILDAMITNALHYYRDFVAPTKVYVAMPEEMKPALEQLITFLEGAEGKTSEEIQGAVYAAGKENDHKLPLWFKALYQMLLGQERGPRLGTFFELYGVSDSLKLIRAKQQELG